MPNEVQSPEAWSDDGAPIVLHTPDGKPFGFGRKVGDGHEPLDPHAYTREQIGQLQEWVVAHGGVGSYQEGHRRYIINVLHQTLGMAS